LTENSIPIPRSHCHGQPDEVRHITAAWAKERTADMEEVATAAEEAATEEAASEAAACEAASTAAAACGGARCAGAAGAWAWGASSPRAARSQLLWA